MWPQRASQLAGAEPGMPSLGFIGCMVGQLGYVPRRFALSFTRRRCRHLRYAKHDPPGLFTPPNFPLNQLRSLA
jgi:hypothetical protein